MLEIKIYEVGKNLARMSNWKKLGSVDEGEVLFVCWNRCGQNRM